MIFFIMSKLAFGVWTPPCSKVCVDRNKVTGGGGGGGTSSLAAANHNMQPVLNIF